MRRKEREVTDIKEIREVLDICKVCRLGIADEGGAYIFTERRKERNWI